MSVRVDIEDYNNIKDALEKICECGHILGYHGFTDNYDYSTGGHYLWVSQCVICGTQEGGCLEFEEKAPSE